MDEPRDHAEPQASADRQSPPSQRQVLSATAWTITDGVARQVLQLVVTIVLARLLTPSEFGIVAMLALFTGIAAVFIEGGFTAALIQADEIDREDASTVFYFQIAVATLLAGTLVIAGPMIAGAFGHPLIVPLSWMAAVTLIISAIGAAPVALLTRKLDFRTQAIAGLTSTVVSGGAAIALAANGAGAWALATQSLVAAIAVGIMTFALSGWRPLLVFRLSALERLGRFGRYMLATGVLLLCEGIPGAVVGKLFGAAALGQYNRAFYTNNMVTGLIQSTIGRIVLPVFSSFSDDQARFHRAHRRAIEAFAAVCAPALLGLLACAEQFTLVLFGSAWAPSIPLLQIFALGAVFWPLSIVNSTVLYARGHSKLFFQLTFARYTFAVFAIAVTASMGVAAIACAHVAGSLAAFLLFASASGRLFGYGVVSQLRDTCLWYLGASIMAAVVWSLGRALHLQPSLELAVLVCVGMLVYGAFVFAVKRGYIVDLMRSVRSGGALTGTTP